MAESAHPADDHSELGPDHVVGPTLSLFHFSAKKLALSLAHFSVYLCLSPEKRSSSVQLWPFGSSDKCAALDGGRRKEEVHLTISFAPSMKKEAREKATDLDQR